MTDKPFRLEAKLRNNRILKAKEELGLTVKELSEKAGIHFGQFYRLASFRESPRLKSGVWSLGAEKLAMALGHSVEYLWPEETLQVEKSAVTREFSLRETLTAGQALDLLGGGDDRTPEEIVLEEERSAEINSLIGTLNEREQFILRSWHNGYHLWEIGHKMDLSVERVRQLLARAEARVRKAAQRQGLTPYEDMR